MFQFVIKLIDKNTFLKYLGALYFFLNLKVTYVRMTSYMCFGDSNYWQLDCMFNRLFMLTYKKTLKLHIADHSQKDSTLTKGQ